MTDWINAVGVVMLLVIPISLISVVHSLSGYREKWGCDMPLWFFMAAWCVSYLYSLLFAAVGFVGTLGIAMLVGAFR